MANLSRNIAFSVALDYLYKEGLVSDQQELSEKTGITESTISRILNDKVKKPSEETIRRLNKAFGNIFNPEYFRCSSFNLLIKDVLYFKQHPEKSLFYEGSNVEQVAESEKEYQAIPKWADSLIQLVSSQVKTIEELRREITNLREEIKQLKK